MAAITGKWSIMLPQGQKLPKRLQNFNSLEVTSVDKMRILNILDATVLTMHLKNDQVLGLNWVNFNFNFNLFLLNLPLYGVSCNLQERKNNKIK